MSGRRKILARQERQAEVHLERPGSDLFAEYHGKKSSVKKEEGFVGQGDPSPDTVVGS